MISKMILFIYLFIYLYTCTVSALSFFKCADKIIIIIIIWSTCYLKEQKDGLIRQVVALHSDAIYIASLYVSV